MQIICFDIAISFVDKWIAWLHVSIDKEHVTLPQTPSKQKIEKRRKNKSTLSTEDISLIFANWNSILKVLLLPI